MEFFPDAKPSFEVIDADIPGKGFKVIVIYLLIYKVHKFCINLTDKHKNK